MSPGRDPADAPPRQAIAEGADARAVSVFRTDAASTKAELAAT